VYFFVKLVIVLLMSTTNTPDPRKAHIMNEATGEILATFDTNDELDGPYWEIEEAQVEGGFANEGDIVMCFIKETN
jgi:hypothetical protein